MICSSFRAVVYPVGLISLRVCRISRTLAGPPSHKTRKMASSPSVGRGSLDGMSRLLTKCFVNVNETFRHSARLRLLVTIFTEPIHLLRNVPNDAKRGRAAVEVRAGA